MKRNIFWYYNTMQGPSSMTTGPTKERGRVIEFIMMTQNGCYVLLGNLAYRIVGRLISPPTQLSEVIIAGIQISAARLHNS